MHRGDSAFVRERLAGVRGILDWYARHVDRTGMLGPMPHWNYMDWTNPWPRGVPPGADNGHSATISLLYAYALQRAAELEDGVGDARCSARRIAREERACCAAVRSRAWDAKRRLFRDSPDTISYSQQTNVLAILTDAAPVAEQRALMERVLSDTTLTHASYYFGFYVLEALRKAGLGDRYIEQLAPWQTMLRAGPNVSSGESRADAIGHARMGRASQLRIARDRAGCASGERRVQDGGDRAVTGSVTSSRGSRSASARGHRREAGGRRSAWVAG